MSRWAQYADLWCVILFGPWLPCESMAEHTLWTGGRWQRARWAPAWRAGSDGLVLPAVRCPLLAQMRSAGRVRICLLFGV